MSLFINPHVAAHPSFLQCNTKGEFLKNILSNIWGLICYLTSLQKPVCVSSITPLLFVNLEMCFMKEGKLA